MKKNYFLLIMAFCCLFSVTQKSYGQLSFDSTPVPTARVVASYTYSSFASDGTSNRPAMTSPTKPPCMSFATTGSPVDVFIIPIQSISNQKNFF